MAIPATTKMSAVVKDMIRKIGPGDKKIGVESDDYNAEDDVELIDMALEEIDEVSGHPMKIDVVGAIEIDLGCGSAMRQLFFMHRSIR